jgi:hypothetical protein
MLAGFSRVLMGTCVEAMALAIHVDLTEESTGLIVMYELDQFGIDCNQ